MRVTLKTVAKHHVVEPDCILRTSIASRYDPCFIKQVDFEKAMDANEHVYIVLYCTLFKYTLVCYSSIPQIRKLMLEHGQTDTK